MNQNSKKSISTRQLTGLALFTAIVVVLQLLGSFLRFGMVSVSLVLVPIVIGAALYGVWAGAWLGFVFSVVVVLTGDCAAFYPVSVPAAIGVCLAKGTLAGTCAGAVYALLRSKNDIAATVAAAFVCPVVNTGIFFLGCWLFFIDTINGWAAATGFENAGLFMIIGLAGLNFVFELIVNMVLSPTIVRLVHIAGRTE